jgi:hypothetical protein
MFPHESKANVSAAGLAPAGKPGYANRQKRSRFTRNSMEALRLMVAVAILIAAALMTLAGRMEAANPAITYTQVAEGSTTTHRPVTDDDSGEVYIYVGGFFPVGTHPAAFRYLFDLTHQGNTTGYITPLLFEYNESLTAYTVVGIGKGFAVTLNSAAQTIPFDVIQGTKVTTNGFFTFGYVNATVNSSGLPVLISPGTVDFGQPAQSGAGVGGPGTSNVWKVTATSPSPVVTLGTTFGVPGADYPFYPGTRTYSAQAIGFLAAR